MSGSSYIQLPKSIADKRAIINPKNTDQQCFKWAILAKHVVGEKKFRVNENYTEHEDKYIFDGISFPTPLSDISKFEKKQSKRFCECLRAREKTSTTIKPSYALCISFEIG